MTTAEKFKAKREKLFSRVVKSDKCWEWQGCKSRRGYGVLSFDGKRYAAHRLSWSIHHKKPIPASNEFICHHCDNPSCVRPSHLFKGTPRDNVLDMVKKKRHWQNKKRFCYKGHEFIEENIAWSAKGRTCRQCRKERSRRERGKLTDAENIRKLSPEDVLEVRRIYKRGDARKLAKKYGCTKANIIAIIARITWKNI